MVRMLPIALVAAALAALEGAFLHAMVVTPLSSAVRRLDPAAAARAEARVAAHLAAAGRALFGDLAPLVAPTEEGVVALAAPVSLPPGGAPPRGGGRTGGAGR